MSTENRDAMVFDLQCAAADAAYQAQLDAGIKVEGAQAWLPIGQRVMAPDEKGFYLPTVYTTAGPFKTRRGEVVEHLSGGAIAVRFEGYANTVDYSAGEAHRFTRCY